jgi:hypothetical protein
MLGRVAHIRTDDSKERVLSIITVTRIDELVTLMMEAIRSSETSSLPRATQRNIPEDSLLQLLRFFGNNYVIHNARLNREN